MHSTKKKTSKTITFKQHSRTWNDFAVCYVNINDIYLSTTPGFKFTGYLDSIYTSERNVVLVYNMCDYRQFADIIFLIY